MPLVTAPRRRPRTTSVLPASYSPRQALVDAGTIPPPSHPALSPAMCAESRTATQVLPVIGRYRTERDLPSCFGGSEVRS